MEFTDSFGMDIKFVSLGELWITTVSELMETRMPSRVVELSPSRTHFGIVAFVWTRKVMLTGVPGGMLV